MHNSFILSNARSESRTRTPLLARDFKSLVSTIPPSELWMGKARILELLWVNFQKKLGTISVPGQLEKE